MASRRRPAGVVPLARYRGRVRAVPDTAGGRGADDGSMSIQPVTSQVPAGPVLVAALGAQLLDDVLFFLIPPTAVVAPLAGLVAILLTAGAARALTAGRTGPVVARTGLVVGAASAGLGLIVGGLGWVALLLAGITVVAGVAGAVAGRGLTGPRLP